MEMNYQILISNQQSAVSVSDDELIRVATLTLQTEGVVRAEISVALVDDPEIHRLNREYLQHDYPTDVISFLLDSGDADPRGMTNSAVRSTSPRRTPCRMPSSWVCCARLGAR